MSIEAIKAQRGDILADLEETQAQLRFNRIEARRIAFGLRLIADRLDQEPERLVLPNEPTDLRWQNATETKIDALDTVKMIEVRDALRTLKLREIELLKQRDGN